MPSFHQLYAGMPRRGMAGAQLSIWLIFSFSVICATSARARSRYCSSFWLRSFILYVPLSSYFVSLAHNAKAKDCEGLTFILRRHADFYVVLAGGFFCEQNCCVAMGPSHFPRVII